MKSFDDFINEDQFKQKDEESVVGKAIVGEAEITDEYIDDKIKDLFIKYPSPSDIEIHKLADELKLDASELEERIYKLLGNLLKK